MATKTIQSIALDPTDNHKYIITLTDKIAKGEAAKLNYTKGDVAAADTGLLQNIIDFVITNNVTVAIPHLVSATTNTAGTQVILTFDVNMANPTGKQGEFTIKANNTSLSISSASLDTDAKRIILTVGTAIANGQSVTASYTKGTVLSAEGGVLESFADVSVTNNVPAPSPYQQWNGYPNSPDLTTTYPYQLIYRFTFSGTNYYRLVECTSKMRWLNGHLGAQGSYSQKIYQLSGGAWSLAGSGSGTNNDFDDSSSYQGTLLQCNNDVYADTTYTTLAMAKTTT